MDMNTLTITSTWQCEVIISVSGEAGRVVVVMTYEGTHPDLPAVMLNSHVDVVPVFEVCTYIAQSIEFHVVDILAQGFCVHCKAQSQMS